MIEPNNILEFNYFSKLWKKKTLSNNMQISF